MIENCQKWLHIEQNVDYFNIEYFYVEIKRNINIHTNEFTLMIQYGKASVA